MATKTKTNVKKKAKVTTFAPKIGKKHSTKATLLVKRTIRCNGRMHEIGLTSKGQLWIPGHTKDELERFILMGDLGNNPCKCAVIIDAWRHGRMDDSQIHDEFKRERIVNNRLVRRLLRHQNRNRNWPDIDVIYGRITEPYTGKVDVNASYAYPRSYTEQDGLRDFVVETVYKTLIHRGWPADLIDYEYGKNTIHLKLPSKSATNGWQHHSIFSVSKSYNHLSPYVNNVLIPDSTLKPEQKKEDIPWRVFIDAAESQIFMFLYNEKRNTQLLERKEEFVKIAETAIEGMGTMPKHAVVTADKETGTVTLTIEHTGLTVQAANRIVNHYRETEECSNRLLKYNRERRCRWFRIPAKPSRGVGSLGGTAETPGGVEFRPIKGERYGL